MQHCHRANPQAGTGGSGPPVIRCTFRGVDPDWGTRSLPADGPALPAAYFVSSHLSLYDARQG